MRKPGRSDGNAVHGVAVNEDGNRWGEVDLKDSGCGDVRSAVTVKVVAVSDYEAEVSGRAVVEVWDCSDAVWGCEWVARPGRRFAKRVATGEEACIDIPTASGRVNSTPYTVRFNGFTAMNLP